MKDKKKITVDELLKAVPNKYELAIIAGRMARKKFLEGDAKNKIMDDVFAEILEDRYE